MAVDLLKAIPAVAVQTAVTAEVVAVAQAAVTAEAVAVAQAVVTEEAVAAVAMIMTKDMAILPPRKGSHSVTMSKNRILIYTTACSSNKK